MFILQALSLPMSASPGGVAGFSLGIFALLISLTALSFRDTDIALAATTATLGEITLQLWAGLSPGACIAASFIIGLVGITSHYASRRVRDLAVHIHAEHQQLHETQNSFRALIEGMSDVVIAHRHNTIVYVNAALLKLCGYANANDIVGQPLRTLFDAPLPATAAIFEIVMLRKDADAVPLEATRISLLFLGAPTEILIGRDITDRKQAIQQLSLNDRMVTMGMLAAGVAHEINNPLAAVRGNLELSKEAVQQQLRRTRLVDSAHSRHIAKSARERILKLADTHLDLAARHDLANALTPLFAIFELVIEHDLAFHATLLTNLESLNVKATQGIEHVFSIAQNLKTMASPQTQVATSVQLRPILESTIGMALHVVRGRVEVKYDLADNPWVLGSASGLIQVLLNLIINASHAVENSETKEVHLSVVVNDDDVIIAVRDTGVGIPEALQAKLFAPFFTTKRAGVGTGMGLSLSKKIVEGMGGQLSFESTVGVGTSFFIKLRKSSTAADTEPAATLPALRRPADRRGQVLVVDDNEMVAEVLRSALADENEVAICTTSLAALELVRQGNIYDVILCDVMMPHMTGVTLHRCIAEVENRLADRMVFISGSIHTDDAAQGLEKLANIRIKKPFDLNEVRAVVRRYVAN